MNKILYALLFMGLISTAASAADEYQPQFDEDMVPTDQPEAKVLEKIKHGHRPVKPPQQEPQGYIKVS